jgi:hypothetical protein
VCNHQIEASVWMQPVNLERSEERERQIAFIAAKADSMFMPGALA